MITVLPLAGQHAALNTTALSLYLALLSDGDEPRGRVNAWMREQVMARGLILRLTGNRGLLAAARKRPFTTTRDLLGREKLAWGAVQRAARRDWR